MEKFFASAQKKPPRELDNGETSRSASHEETKSKALPKGVVIGKDGKPCRSCTSVRDWMAMARQETSKNPSSSTSLPTTATPTTTFPSFPPDCPPDVDTLGNHTWTLLHTISAQYPERPSRTQQSEMKQFLDLFGRLYPCWVCAEDFQTWKKENEPRVEGRKVFGKWMCEAHNEVNRKLGKEEFDCSKWDERWRTGWKNGRCGYSDG